MAFKYFIFCFIIGLYPFLSNAQTADTEAKEVIKKTNEALANIKTSVYKVNQKKKHLSQRDTIYTTAVCSIQAAPKDKLKAYNMVDQEYAYSGSTTYGHMRYDGKRVLSTIYRTDSLHTAINSYNKSDSDEIEGFVGSYSDLLLPNYFIQRTAFNALRLFGAKATVKDGIYLNTPVYIITIAFKDSEDARDWVETHYIRKSDYMPIGFTDFWRWENMEQYNYYEIEYVAVNPDIPVSVFTVDENETIDAYARYAVLKEQIKGFQQERPLFKQNTAKVATVPVPDNTPADATQSLPDYKLLLHNNQIINLKDLKGKVVVLDFWYRSCTGCVLAIPELIKLQEEYKDDLVIIGINPYDDQEDVKDYIDYKKMNYRSTFNYDDKIVKSLNLSVQGYPTTLLYDREGNLVITESGFSSGIMRKLRIEIKKAVNRL